MSITFPGTTIEVAALEKGSSKSLFDGIFATGGITLSQVSIMTGLEPYLVQNWVKRGFVGHPVARVYSREQFARIIIINMLRETMRIEHICGAVDGVLGDGVAGENELYHMYVDMIAGEDINALNGNEVESAAERITAKACDCSPYARKKLRQMLSAMLYAHTSARLSLMTKSTLLELQ